MLFRDEMSERICNARTVTERKENRTLREKGVRPSPILLRCTSKTHGDNAVGFCFFGAPWVRTPMQRGFRPTERKNELPVKQGIDNAL